MVIFLGLHLLLELLVLVGVNSLFDLCLLLEFCVLEDVSFVFDLCLFLEFFCTWGFGLRVWHCICYLSFLYLGMSVVCLLVHVIYIWRLFFEGLQNNTHVEDLTFATSPTLGVANLIFIVLLFALGLWFHEKTMSKPW